MKKLFVLLAFMPLFAFSQMKDVTKFLGIPVDGTKREMIKKLEAKGFELTSVNDNQLLVGEFNGEEVHIFVVTNNNIVYRIMVADKKTRSETDIKIRFNRLCRQFEQNSRYIKPDTSFIIPENEDISYEMAIHNKRYEAVYTQENDSILFNQDLAQLAKEILEKYAVSPTDSVSDDLQNKILSEVFVRAMSFINKKNVWFKISEFGSKYYITMYYDNEYNKANGEDL